ncbi:putative X-ray repair cross-complementing protein 5 [Paratrimastix pyriformis]|uniref:X-ray repair cross-complementing protein 5 n=1 Tax=Paratrimastix pyriformis TaxID=342808 RepID=A0ABQ8UHH6_9EUKA|nr:putative X-ray repair cross-complementing protein 5 [Paratrimastix pyriformis]
MPEALVIILDVGRTMSAKERTPTHFDAAKKAVTLLIQQKIIYNPKDEIGLLLVGTEGTENDLYEEGSDQYAHITLARDMDTCDLEFLRKLERLEASEHQGDLLDAIIVAMDLLIKKAGKRKLDKRLMVITDAASEIGNPEDIKAVVAQFKSRDVRFDVIGLDFVAIEDEDEADEEAVVKHDGPAAAAAGVKPPKFPKDAPREEQTRFLIGAHPTLNPVKPDGDDAGRYPPGVIMRGDTHHCAMKLIAYLKKKTILQRPTFKGDLDIGGVALIPIRECRKKGYLDIGGVSSDPHGSLPPRVDDVCGCCHGLCLCGNWFFLFKLKRVHTVSSLTRAHCVCLVVASFASHLIPHTRAFATGMDARQVACYGATMEVKFPTMKKLSMVALKAKHAESIDVKMQRVYFRPPDMAHEVETEERLKGYRYGKDLVSMSKADEDFLKAKNRSEKCLQLIGFAKREAVPRNHFTSNVELCVHDSKSSQSPLALEALVQALFEMDRVRVVALAGMAIPHVAIVRYINRFILTVAVRVGRVAIVRYIKRAGAAPHLACLIPHIKYDYHAFHIVQLPFAEDVRNYTFPSFASLKKHQPTPAQLAAVDELLTKMDLMQAALDEDGQPMEAIKPRFTYHPVLQHFYQCLQQRALRPDEPLAALDPFIERYVNPDSEVLRRAEDALNAFKAAFPLHKADRYVHRAYVCVHYCISNIISVSCVSPWVHMQIGMSTERVREVRSANPVADFRAMCARRDEDLVELGLGRVGCVWLDEDDIYRVCRDEDLVELGLGRVGCVWLDEDDIYRVCRDEDLVELGVFGWMEMIYIVCALGRVGCVWLDEDDIYRVCRDEDLVELGLGRAGCVWLDEDDIYRVCRDEDLVELAFTQMADMVHKLVTESIRGNFYGRACECVAALREEAIKCDETTRFNKFLRDLKQAYAGHALHADFWKQVIAQKTTLITQEESQDSAVPAAEATQFLSEAEAPGAAAAAGSGEKPPEGGAPAEDADDLLALM